MKYRVIHQTITVRRIRDHSCFVYGAPTTQDSWFPGYAWSILYCRRCVSHLGWRFTLVPQSNEPENRSNIIRIPEFW
jgi:cereblon